MSFFEHFDELRERIMRCLFVFMVGFVLCYFISDPLLEILRRPLFAILPPERQHLYFTGLFENFMTHLKIAGYASVFLFSPYYFYEIWAFVSPGLYPKERKLFLPFISAATIFFVGGALFAYFVLFPVGFKFFVTYGSPSDVAMLTIDSYYGTCLKLLLLFGLAFELPIFICLLGFLGIIDAADLREHRRTAIILITVVSALFAPPDAVSMLLLGVPLVFLYEAAIWVVQWMGVGRAPKFAGSRVESETALASPTHPWEGRSR
jgi:sec-independent protein translocase protein TatC